MSILDWASEKVQNFSGETDRRENVLKLKQIKEEVTTVIKTAVNQLNEIINSFNSIVTKLNHVRKNQTYPQIDRLQRNLHLFGRLKSIDNYVDEDMKAADFTVPERQLINTQEYIDSVDWSRSEVFSESYKNGVFGTKKKMHELNLELNAQADKLRLYKEEVEKEFELKKDKTRLEIDVANAYIEVISLITNEISSRIVPGLSVISSFMIAKHIADYSDDLEEAEFNDVLFSAELLKNTEYDQYYNFIKNAFAFYIVAVKVSTTKVLTNLLSDSVTEDDAKVISDAHNAVVLQSKQISEYRVGVV